jgi:hypothetical protein
MDSKLNECNKFSLFFIKNVKSHNNTLKEQVESSQKDFMALFD